MALTEAEARALCERVLRMSRAETCSLVLTSSDSGNIRTARNAVSTSGFRRNTTLGITATFGRRSGSTSVNAFDDAALERAVRQAEALAQVAPEDPEFMPPVGPQAYADTPAFSEATAATSAARRAEIAGLSLEAARRGGCESAAFLDHGATWVALANSTGNFGFHRQTRASFTVTARTQDGLGSGFGTADAIDIGDIDAAAASRIAVEKALASRETRAIEPGKYTVVLEPAASCDLLQQVLLQMDARSADEGRSYLAKRGGGTRLGEKLLDERVTIHSDPADPRVATGPWAPDGQARGRTVWYQDGVVTNLAYSRYWADKQGRAPLPGPANFIMAGGSASLEDLIRGTARGILVTRTWYIRPVDPQTLLYTGLTRDGTFYIEDGRIRHAIKNMRFNESPVIMLNNVEELGIPVRIRNAETALQSVVPPMRLRDFTFSSLSDAV